MFVMRKGLLRQSKHYSLSRGVGINRSLIMDLKKIKK